MTSSKHRLGKKILILSCMTASAALCAQSARDITFVNRMNDMQMYDYAEMFLDSLVKKNPENPARVNVMLMDTLYRQNKKDDAEKILKTFNKSKDETNWYQAQAVVGLYYFRQGNNPEALKYLQPVIEYVYKINGKQTEWEMPAAALMQMYRKFGMAAESQKLMSWIQGGADENDREKIYQQCLLKMDIIESGRIAEESVFKAFDEGRKQFNASATEEEKKKLQDLLGKKNEADRAYNDAKNKKNANDIKKADDNCRAVYKEIGALLKVDLERMWRYQYVRGGRAGRLNLFLKRSDLTQDQIKQLCNGDPDDWQSNLYTTMFDLEKVQWGGQDVATLAAVATSGKGFYLLGAYDAGIKSLKKFKEMFDSCNDQMEQQGKLEYSPGIEAELWEGYCNLGLARQANAKKDKKTAVSYYKRAFKHIGKVLKSCPKHKDGAKSMVDFSALIDELSVLQPELADKLAAEKAKLPTPEAKAPEEKLVTAVAEENFRQKKYKAVIDELLPSLIKNRTSGAVPELLDRLILSMVLTKDYIRAWALADWMMWRYPNSEYTLHVIKNSGNLIWQEAEKLKAAPAAKGKPAASAAGLAAQKLYLKNIAIDFYHQFLKIGISDIDAANVALRLAREFYNRANELGRKLNAEKDQDARAEMKKEWLAAFDQVVTNYKFIIDNFGNKDTYVDEAYLRSAECYVTTERFDEAAEAYLRFCDAGSENKLSLIKAKANAAEAFYRSASVSEKAGRALLEEAAAIVIPGTKEGEAVAPAPTQPKSEKAADAAAEAQGDDTAAEAEVMKKKKEQLEADAKEEAAKAKANYQKAIDQTLELTDKWLAKGSELSKAVAKNEDVPKILVRAASLLPWLYDGVGDKQKAIDAFDAYIKLNPEDKSIPGYLMRIGTLYTEIGKTDEAQKVLEDLSSRFPDSPEGKNAKFFLARNLYEHATYDKALEILNEIFKGPLKSNLTVSNLRWVSTNLAACPSVKYAKDFAELSIQACNMLLAKIRKPDYKEWVGDLKAIEMSKDAEACKLYENQICQRLNFDAGCAAMLLGKYNDAIKYFTTVYDLDNNTPYYNKVFFNRADSYCKLQQYELARKDLNRVGSRAMTRVKGKQPNYGIYNKAQVLVGDTFVAEKKYDKAYTIYSMVAGPAFQTAATTPGKPDDPEDDSALYVEKSIYQAAYTAAKLGKVKEQESMTAKYKEHYPKGKYQVEIDNLPAPETKAPASAEK